VVVVVLVRQPICLRAHLEFTAVPLHDRVQVGEVGIAEAVLERIARLPPVDLPCGRRLRWPSIRYCTKQVQAGGRLTNVNVSECSNVCLYGRLVQHATNFPSIRSLVQVQRYCFSLDLRPNPVLIAEYVHLHQQVWQEVQESIRNAGVIDMQLYRLGNRLFMIMDTSDSFTLEQKAAMDASNPKVVEWEILMGKYQEVDVAGDPTRRWQLMEKIFQLAL